MPAFAILSDIHSNITALKAAVADARAAGIAQFVCLGDIVGYGPRPKECVTLVRRIVSACVKGNHDWAVAHPEDPVAMNDLAMAGIEYSRKHLGRTAKKWLRDLPMQTRFRGTLLVHSSPVEPEEWPYVFTAEDAEKPLRKQGASVCFIGHTHLPRLYSLVGGQNPRRINPQRYYLPPSGRYLVNVGSVGQPRNEDPRAQYATYDPAKRVLEFRRCEYNIEDTVCEIAAAALPEPLGERLRYGL